MNASQLQPGMRVAGFLPAVKGIRSECTETVVTRVRQHHQWIIVTWPDGTEAGYHPEEYVEVVA